MNKRIIIGSDHGGYDLKEYLIAHLKEQGYEVQDVGTNSKDSCNYPDFALKVALAVQKGDFERGLVVCTSGEGVAIMANKVKGIRCGIGYNEEVSHLIVEHNDANIMALGAKYLAKEEAAKYVDAFLNAKHLGERHAKRVSIIKDYEEKVYR